MKPLTAKAVFRYVAAFWIFGWFIKFLFLFPYIAYHAYEYPISHRLFPEFFLNPWTSFVAYLIPVAGILSILRDDETVLRITAAIFVLCSIVLALHINTYNDATFVASFWSGLWLLWLSFHFDAEDNMKRQAIVLAQCLIGVIFLGGFIGKLTDAYWNGQVVYNIFMKQETHWPFSIIVQRLPFEGQMMWAGWISRSIILFEGLLILTPLIPIRYSGLIALCLLPVLTIFRGWQILSVIACLIGLMLICWLWDRSLRRIA